MQVNIFGGLFSSRKGLIILVIINIFNFSLQADASASAEQREKLIELSLGNSRNPQFLDSLAQELLKYDDKECKARGFFLKGLAATFQGDIDSALVFYRQSLPLIPEGGQYGERFTYFMVLKNVGIAHYRKNQHQQGDSIFNKMAEMALAKGDSFHYASALSNLGNALNIRRDFKGAIEKLKEAILIEENLQSQGVASTYLKIGTIFGRMDQPQEALVWFRKSQARALENDVRLQGRIYNNFAVALRSLGDLDSAQYYLFKALALHQQTGSLIDQAVVLENLARNDIYLMRFSHADSLLNEAYALLPSEGRGRSITISRLWMSSLNLALKQNKLLTAKGLVKSLEDADIAIQNETDFLQLKVNYFEQLGQKDSAIYFLKIIQAKKNELNKLNDAAKIKQEANTIELAEINRARALESKQEAFLSRLLVFLGVLLVIVVFYLLRRRNIKSGEIEQTMPRQALGGALVKDEYKPLMVQKEAALEIESEAVLKLKSKAVIKVADILYLQSEGHYVNIYLRDRENPEVERISLNALLEDLGEDTFQRIHRSYVVNVSNLKAAYSNRVLLKSGQELPVTRTYNVALRERFNKK